MKLIDRYVSEVGKRLLVFQGREDIEKELRSTLEDMLEERVEQAGKPADEAMEVELLKEYGSPDTVAATYNPHPYLISPRTFPLFLMILKLVVFGIVIGLSVVTIIQVFTQSPMMGGEFTEIIGDGLSNIVSTSIAAFGYVVLAFAILERTVPDLGIRKEDFDEKWDPTSLTREPHPDTVKRSDLVAEIVFTFIGLAIINEVFYIPLFSDEFRKFVPWINIIFTADIFLNIYLLRKAVWDTATRIVKIAMEASTIVVVVLIWRVPEAFRFTEVVLNNIPENSSVNLETITKVFNLSISIALAIVIIIASIELIKALIGLIRSRTNK